MWWLRGLQQMRISSIHTTTLGTAHCVSRLVHSWCSTAVQTHTSRDAAMGRIMAQRRRKSFAQEAEKRPQGISGVDCCAVSRLVVLWLRYQNQQNLRSFCILRWFIVYPCTMVSGSTPVELVLSTSRIRYTTHGSCFRCITHPEHSAGMSGLDWSY